MKSRIREEIRSLRESSSRDELRAKSDEIMRNLFRAREFREAGSVLFYVSTKGEVMTERMIRESLASGKRVSVPAVDGNGDSLVACEIRDFDRDLAPGAFGIMEPGKGCRREIDASSIDLVVVPGIAFDRMGARVGYGRGFYDRLLSSMPYAKKVALAYGFQVVDEIPREAHDVCVEKIITENGAISTR